MVCMSAPPDLLCGALDGAHDPEMRSAAAEITLQRLLDVAVARIGVFVEQRLRGHDHAVDAVAALRGLLVDEGLLDRVRLVDRSEENTSELQSLMRISYDVFCLKKKNEHNNNEHKNNREL